MRGFTEPRGGGGGQEDSLCDEVEAMRREGGCGCGSGGNEQAVHQ